jgi:uncharacterized membrane protein YfcA
MNPLGVYLLTVINEEVLRIVLGLLIVGVSIFMMFDAKQRIVIKPTAVNAVSAGLVSGIMGGMYNIGGPPLVLYFVQTARDHLNYKASLEFVFLVSSIIRLITHLMLGTVTRQDTGYVIVALAAGVAGAFLGLTLLQRMNLARLTRFVSGIMLIAGFSLVLR